MNGFEKHGIDHLSPSAINLWIDDPAHYIFKYVLGQKSPSSPAMWRGISVEDGVKAIIAHGQSFADAIRDAEATYDAKTAFGGDSEKRQQERDLIKPMIEIAVDDLTEFGKPSFAEDGSQHKIELTAAFEDWSIPVIGFLDFKFPSFGTIIDLKTVGRLPNNGVMSEPHQRQRAIYAKASGNMAVKFLYVTPKKSLLLEDGDATEILTEIKAHIARLERFLSLGDKDTLRSVVPVNPSSFYWNGCEQARRELFNV